MRTGTRLVVVVALVVVLAGVGIADRLATSAPQRFGAPAPAMSVPAASDESSAWYCWGGGTTSSLAPVTLELVNTTAAAVHGTLTTVATSGRSLTQAVTVPALQTVTVVPAVPGAGGWLGAALTFFGGGVLATQSVGGPAGWSQVPCSRVTAPTWYFPSGSTADGSVDVTLFNPTVTDAVVDLSFLTRSGVLQPQPYQGLVVGPRQVLDEHIGDYVQDQTQVATIVHARAGAVVAGEFQVRSDNGVQGASLLTGAPSPARRWVFPASANPQLGSTVFHVFNPTAVPERVTVAVRLGSGPVAPFVELVAPASVWSLVASQQTRIPTAETFAATVTATGPGVVVDRVVTAPAGAAAPQWGTVMGVPQVAGTNPRIAYLAPPGTATAPAVSGAQPIQLVVMNPSPRRISVVVQTVASRGAALTVLGRATLSPGAFSVFARPLAASGVRALTVRGSGPTASIEDLAPAGAPGVVSLVGVPPDSG